MTNSSQRLPLLLSIDDESAMREIVMTVGEQCGFNTLGVETPRDIHTALIEEPEVIVLDMIMPEMDGIEVIWELARRKSKASLIILSGFDPRVILAARMLAEKSQLNLVASLRKPVDIELLREYFLTLFNGTLAAGASSETGLEF